MGMAKAYGRSAGWWLESFNPIENALKPLILHFSPFHQARLAQSVERKALNLVVVGSSPTVGVYYFSDMHVRAL